MGKCRRRSAGEKEQQKIKWTVGSRAGGCVTDGHLLPASPCHPGGEQPDADGAVNHHLASGGRAPAAARTTTRPHLAVMQLPGTVAHSTPRSSSGSCLSSVVGGTRYHPNSSSSCNSSSSSCALFNGFSRSPELHAVASLDGCCQAGSPGAAAAEAVGGAASTCGRIMAITPCQPLQMLPQGPLGPVAGRSLSCSETCNTMACLPGQHPGLLELTDQHCLGQTSLSCPMAPSGACTAAVAAATAIRPDVPRLSAAGAASCTVNRDQRFCSTEQPRGSGQQ